ncbi:MAG: helix-turn-helix transcriptional regulator [Acidobacteria bacterium]|nr:helix-turn-helix transcriptional regulator [Acidobacteriota bacterium]
MPLQEAAFHILVALGDSDKHGYAIMQDVADRTDGNVRLNAGTLYTTIRRLLEQGLIIELDDRPDADDERRRYYCLTAAGRREVAEEASRLQRMLKLAKAAGLGPRG